MQGWRPSEQVSGPPRPAFISQHARARALRQSRIEACLDERPAEQDVVQDGAAHDERLGEHLMMEAITGHQRP